MRKYRRLLIVLPLVVAIALLSVLFAVPALAQDATVTIDAPSIVPPGGTFTARLNITTVTDLSLATYRITYNPLVLAVTDVTDGEIGGSPADISNVDTWPDPESEWYGWETDSGELAVIQGAYVAGEHGLTGSGYLVEIEFSVIGEWCDTSDISFVVEDCAAYDYDEQEIDIAWTGTSIKVAPDYDVNGDGWINVLDLSSVGIHWMEHGPTPGWIREDANGDTWVNVLDLSLIGIHWMENCY